MSTLTLIRFTEKETDAFPARMLDRRMDGDMVERSSFKHIDPLPRVGDEIVIGLRARIPGAPTRTWYGREKETFTERQRRVTLKLDKVTHDIVLGVIELQCVFVREDAA